MSKKDKAKNENVIEVAPEVLAELQGAGIQTVMNLGLAERLALEDIQDRIFYLDGEVDEDVLHTVTMQIYKINGEESNNNDCDNAVPITIIIDSEGGEVLSGMALIDAINASRVPCVGVCVGKAYSMAFNIFTQCHFRIGSKNSSYLYHDGSCCYSNSTTKTKNAVEFYDKLDKRMDKLIASKTKFTVEHLENIKSADNFYFADEGKEKGFVDAIIGEDIDMPDIFGLTIDTNCNCEDCKSN